MSIVDGVYTTEEAGTGCTKIVTDFVCGHPDTDEGEPPPCLAFITLQLMENVVVAIVHDEVTAAVVLIIPVS